MWITLNMLKLLNVITKKLEYTEQSPVRLNCWVVISTTAGMDNSRWIAGGYICSDKTEC